MVSVHCKPSFSPSVDFNIQSNGMTKQEQGHYAPLFYTLVKQNYPTRVYLSLKSVNFEHKPLNIVVPLYIYMHTFNVTRPE